MLSLLNRFKYGPVFASALLFNLAFPPFNLFLLVFVALIPWLLFLRAADKKSAIRSGYIFGLIFWLWQCNWIIPFVGKWTGSIGLALVPWLLIPTLVIWYFPILAALIHRAFGIGWLWAIPLLWAGMEFIRSQIPYLAFPWGLLANPLHSAPILIQPAAVGEIYLVSAWVVLANVLGVLIAEKAPARTTSRTMSVWLAVLVLSAGFYLRPPQSGDRKVISIGQTGVDMAFGNPSEQDAKSLEAVLELKRLAEANGSEAIVFPEKAVSLYNAPMLQGPLSTLFGTVIDRDQASYQSAIAFEQGKQTSTDKTRLVIFGEYVPFRDKLPFLKSFNLPSGDLKPGLSVGTVDWAGHKSGPSLCFEGLFPDVARIQAQEGARSLSILAIDDWYQGTTAMDQLAAGSVWRAVENQLPVFRAATLGISQYVNERGDVISRAPYGERVAMRVEAIIPEKSTAFPFRHLFGMLCALGIVAFWGYSPRKEKKA